MVNNLLTSTKIDHAQIVNLETVNIDDFIKSLITKMKNRWPSKLVLNLEADSEVKIDKELFETALLNIIDNAFQYSLPDPQVKIQTRRIKDDTKIEILDNGIGITDSEAKKIFTKFYRVGNEDTRHTKGSGLGLYLSREIIHLHSGSIQLSKNHPKGSIFSLVIPKHG